MRYGIQQFVLRVGEKHLRGLVRFVVVIAQGEEIAHFLIKPFFRCPDIPNLRQKFIEVIRSAVWVLQPFAVDDKSFAHEFRQISSCPLAELRATRTSYPKTDSKNHLQRIECYIVLFAVRGSC